MADGVREVGSALVPVGDGRAAVAVPGFRPGVAEAARGYASASRAASTRKKYEAGWRDFAAWCAAEGQEALPGHPAVVAAFLAAEAARGLSPSAAQVKLSAIGWVHRRAGRQNPLRADEGALVAEVMAGVRRSHGRAPARKAAADADVCRDVLHHIRGDGLREVRDRALIAFGMASCMRRSEIVALDRSDVVRAPGGLRVMVRRSKGDQEGRGVEIAVPEGRRLRPAALLEAWIAAAGVENGPLFRRLSNDGRRATAAPMSDRAVARVVQARAAAAGLDPQLFAGHSLRAGFLTSAARAKASIFQMQQQSRHRSVQVLAGYVRSARLFEDHAGEEFL